MKPTAVMNFCPNCGTNLRHLEGQWPKHCPNSECKRNEHYHPVLTVVVALIDTGHGLIIIERNIEPQRAGLALPGGYQNYGETVEEAASRETREEIGLTISPRQFTFFKSALSTTGMSLLFFKTTVDLDPKQIRLCEKEIRSWHVLGQHNRHAFSDLCFPSHQEAFNDYFAQR